MTDLVERLRALADEFHQHSPHYREAADEIGRLETDCDRLREFNTKLCDEIERMGGCNRRVPQCETSVTSNG
jgi:predicted nuclease with TOPRIM domain